MKAKISSLRESRAEQAQFKTQLNNWVHCAPKELRGDYQKVAAEIEKCLKYKTHILSIENSEICNLPPIPDHVKHLNFNNLSKLTDLSGLPSHLESLEVLHCSKIAQWQPLPLHLRKLSLLDTPYANLAEIILKLSRNAQPLTVSVNRHIIELLTELILEKKKPYEGAPVDFFWIDSNSKARHMYVLG